MKKRMMIILAAVLAAGVAYCETTASNAVDVSVSGSADVASAYVYRGVTLNDGFVFQPGASITAATEDYGALTIGTWANYDMEDNKAGRSEFSEVDYYATYALPTKDVDLSTTYTAYTYPYTDSSVDTDHEITLTIGKAIGESGFYPSLAINYGLDGAIEDETYIQGGLGYTKALTEALDLSSSVKVAYLVDAGSDDGSDGGPDGFNDATGSIGLTYKLTENWSIKSTATYIAQLDDDVLTNEEHDTELVGMLSLACSF